LSIKVGGTHVSFAHIFTYTKHTTSNNSEVLAVAWSPNGKYIASSGLEGTAQIWHAV